MGKQLRSILRLPSALEDHHIIELYMKCCACGKRIISSELALSHLVQGSDCAETFIKKANALVYRRSTWHDENCRWGIPTVRVNLPKTSELIILPRAKRHSEWTLRGQMLKLRSRA